MLSVSLAAPANAAKCSKADLNSMERISAQMAMTKFSGDLKGVFKALAKAKKSTRSSSMRSFYTKFENTVERDYGDVGPGTDSNKIWLNLISKKDYNRC